MVQEVQCLAALGVPGIGVDTAVHDGDASVELSGDEAAREAIFDKLHWKTLRGGGQFCRVGFSPRTLTVELAKDHGRKR